MARTVKAYCIECRGNTDMADVLSLVEELPSLTYCTKCRRAYKLHTISPLDLDGTGIAYFDKDCPNREAGEVTFHGRLVRSKEELTSP